MDRWNAELYHHGIKGQRWGVRRFQNEDGSLTEAGKRRYNVDVEGARQAYQDARESTANVAKSYKSGNSSALELKKARAREEMAKKAIGDEKIKEKLNSEKHKSKHRIKLEEHYKQKGMSDEEAEIAAYRRARTEKIIAITAGVTLAAAAGYAAYKYHDYASDKILKSDMMLQNISQNPDKGVSDAFYAAFKKGDKEKYVGTFGKELFGRQTRDFNRTSGPEVYKTDIKTGKNIKIASDKSGLKALRELMESDSEYSKNVREQVNEWHEAFTKAGMGGKQADVLNAAKKALDSGKINSKVYDAVNLGLVDHGERGSKISSGLYSKLKEKGYGALGDVNDRRLSGYNTKSPLILFDNSGLDVVSRKLLSHEDLNTAIKNIEYKNDVNDLFKQLGLQTAAVGVAVGANKMITNTKRNNTQDKIVADYKKEHPNTNLSYNEILENYYK